MQTLFLAFLLSGPDNRPPHPADAIAAALRVAKAEPNPKNVRFLWLGHHEEKSREATWRALAGHLNQLCRESEIVKCEPAGGWSGELLRIDPADFGWPLEVWEKLADQEPYLHVGVKVTIAWDGFKWVDNGTGEHKRTIRRVALAPWVLDTPERLAAATDLAALSGSNVPVVMADWFLWQTCQQAERVPGYYDFLGIKNQKDFEKLIGFSREAMGKRKELLEVVAKSGVARQPRRIAAFPTIGRMHLWKTFDNQLAEGERNPLRVLTDEFKFDASEEFGPLPNGFWTWGLFAADGTRQDSAPDFIGPDKTSPSNDGRIHVCLSCVRCHYSPGNGGRAGIQGIDGWSRHLFREGGTTPLQSPSPDKLRELRQKYLRDLAGPVDDDRRIHRRSVLEATGLEPDEWSAAFAKLYASHDADVGLDRAAADCGVTPARLREAMDAKRKRGGLDLILATLLDGGKVGIRQWSEAIVLAHEVLK